MSEIEDLKGRVENAVEKLASVQDVRRHNNQTLTQLLADLEVKFNARTEELDYCNGRIALLTRENGELTSLLDRLVSLIEADPDAAEDDPVVKASRMAADLLESWSGEAAADTAAPAAAAPEVQFENVSGDELAAESEDADRPDYPAEVAQAVQAALRLSKENPDGVAAEMMEGIDGELSAEDAAALLGIQEAVLEAVAEELDVPADQTDTPDRVIAEDDTGGEAMAEEDETVAEDEDVLSVDIDIPDDAFGGDTPEESARSAEGEEDAEASIRAMMARLEEAAAKARFTAPEPDAAEEKPKKGDGDERAA